MLFLAKDIRYHWPQTIGLLTIGLCLVLGQSAFGQATSTELSKPSKGKNIVQLDFAHVTGSLLASNSQDFIFPVLASYERRMGEKWSLGGEVLMNGGYQTARRNGVAVLGRYYVLEDKSALALGGVYISPIVSYRDWRVIDGYVGNTPVTIHARRQGAGSFIGWQIPFTNKQPRAVLIDLAVGAIYWNRIGSDRVDNHPSYYEDDENWMIKTGLKPDMRLGLGYQF